MALGIEQILKQIAGLVGQMNNTQQKQAGRFDMYGPISPDGGTLQQSMKNGIRLALGGGIIGHFASMIAGRLFSTSGNVANWMALTLYPEQKTYAGAFLNRQARSMLHVMGQNLDLLDNLTKKFVTDWFRVTGSMSLEQAAEKAKGTNWFSLPRLASTFLDPTNIQATAKWMSMTQAQATNWLMHRYDVTNAGASTARNKAFNKAVLETIMLASSWLLLTADQRRNSNRTRSYGGYSTAAVALLTSIITGLRDFMSKYAVGRQDKLEDRVKELIASTVSAITTALGPLRDVFQNDITATVGAIKAVTGRSITSMGSDLLGLIAARMTDTMRYTGIAPALFAKISSTMGQLIDSTVKNSGGNWLSYGGRQGATLLLLTSTKGAAPFGMSLHMYSTMTRDLIVGAHAGLMSDLAAKAYSMYRSKSGENTKDFALFLANANYNLNTMMLLAGAKNIALLNQGTNSAHYIKAKQSGYASLVGMRGHLDQLVQVNSMIKAGQLSSEQLDLMNKTFKNSAAVLILAGISDDAELAKIAELHGLVGQGQGAEFAKTYRMFTAGDLGGKLIAYSVAQNRRAKFLKYAANSKALRSAFHELDQEGSGDAARAGSLLLNWAEEQDNKSLSKESKAILGAFYKDNTNAVKFINDKLGGVKDTKFTDYIHRTITAGFMGTILDQESFNKALSLMNSGDSTKQQEGYKILTLLSMPKAVIKALKDDKNISQELKIRQGALLESIHKSTFDLEKYSEFANDVVKYRVKNKIIDANKNKENTNSNADGYISDSLIESFEKARYSKSDGAAKIRASDDYKSWLKMLETLLNRLKGVSALSSSLPPLIKIFNLILSMFKWMKGLADSKDKENARKIALGRADKKAQGLKKQGD